MTTILDIITSELNGPLGVGLAANVDIGKDPTCSLEILCTDMERFKQVLTIAVNRGIDDGKLIAAMFSVAQTVVAMSVYEADCNVTKTNVAWKVLDVEWNKVSADLIKDVKANFNKDSMTTGLTLLTATKVTFWQQNHHVGQGSISGYYAKVARTLFPAIDAKVLKDAGWIIGHWASTNQVLLALHVKNIKGVTTLKLTPSDDVKIRLNSYPAGLARHAFAMAVAYKIKSSIYSEFIPSLPELRQIMRNDKVIHASLSSYHIGHIYLTDVAPIIVATIDDETMEALSAFVHAIMPNSTLSNSKACFNINLVRGHSWFTLLTTAKKAILDQAKLSDAEIAKAVAAKKLGEPMSSFIDACFNEYNGIFPALGIPIPIGTGSGPITP